MTRTGGTEFGISVKDSEKSYKNRDRELFEIQKEYWMRRGIKLYLVFKDMTYDEMIEAELNGTITVAEDQEIRILDKSKLSEKELEAFKKKQAFVNDLDAVYGGDYSIFPTKAPKPFYRQKLKEYGFSKANGLRVLQRQDRRRDFNKDNQGSA